MKKLNEYIDEFGKEEVKDILLSKFIEEKIVLEALQIEKEARNKHFSTHYKGIEKDLHIQLLDLVFDEKLKIQSRKIKSYSVQYLSCIGKLNNEKGYTEDQIEQARSMPVESFITTPLRKAGQNKFSALCPFHDEKTPSFTIYQENNSWHCFGCSKHGNNAIDFMMEREGINFKEAMEVLL